ncbi:MAG: glycosyltransferase family 2 protein [Bacteroidales bacterium]|nr:glycosyltransferase family 2 protein [Bacteroidales bacterium]
MKVSIITPTFNSERFIEETIRSILVQTYHDWELLITDDASADHTVNIVKKFAGIDQRIKLFQLNENMGAATARRHSIDQATGRFIAFCDSDDLWTPDKLEKQIGFMLVNNYVFTFAPYHIIDEDGKELGLSTTRSKVNYRDILRTCDIGCLTAVYDRHHLGNMYMANIKKRHDYTLWLEILRKIQYAYSYPEPLGYYRLRPHSISKNKMKTMYYIWKVYRDVEKIPFARSLWYLIVYAFYGLKKYIPLYRKG